MPTIAQLTTVAAYLDGLTSAHTGNGTETGLWKRIAEGLEQGAGVSNTRNGTVTGYMERAALAAEAKWGGSGAEETATEEGLLKRITDAMQLNAGAGIGSLENRFAVRGTLVTFGADVTAPTLTSPTGVQTGNATATVGVTTNEANGTLYHFVSTSSTPPSAATLKAGTGAVVSGSQAISSTGAKSASITGLTASTTYYTHWLHRDAAGNDSAIVSTTGFTTTATGLTAPDINATNTAGTDPQVDIGLKSDHYANDFLDVQRSATSNFAVLTMDITYQITMEDLVDGISNAELVTEGYTNPSGGVYYQRYRIRRADGAYSAWVGFSGDTSAGVSATLVSAQRQFVNYAYSTATFNFTFADAGLAVFQIFVDNQPLNATPQLDGVNLTLVASSVNGVDGSNYLYQGAVTAGTHALTFTYPYNLYANAAAFLVKGVNSTPVDPFSQFFTGSDATVPHVPSHGALAVPSGGVGIAALGIVSGANTDTTWINGTEAYDAGDASTPTANKHSAAIFTSAQVPSFSGQDFRKTSFVAAAWGP